MNAPLQYKTTHLICFSKTGFSLTCPTIFPYWTCIDKLHRYANSMIKAWTVTEEGDCISEPKNKTKSGYSSQAKFTASTARICQFLQKINVWCTWTVQIILLCSIFCQFYCNQWLCINSLRFSLHCMIITDFLIILRAKSKFNYWHKKYGNLLILN